MATIADALHGMISAEALEDLSATIDKSKVSSGIEAVTTPDALNPDGTTVSLSGVGESVILEWDGSTWHTIGGSGFVIS